MTDTILARCRAELFTELQAATGAGSFAFLRNPTEPVSVEDKTVIVQRDRGHRKSNLHLGEDRYVAMSDIEIYVQAGDDDAMTAAIHDAQGFVDAFVGSLNVTGPLLGLAVDVRNEITDDAQEADSDAVQVANLEIEFTTRQNDPYTQSTL